MEVDRSVTVNKTKNADREAWVILEGRGDQQEEVQSCVQESVDCDSEEGGHCRKIERVPERMREDGGRGECASALRKMLAHSARQTKAPRWRKSREIEDLRLRLKKLGEQEEQFEDASSFVQAVLDAMSMARGGGELERMEMKRSYQSFYRACEQLSCFEEVSSLFDPKLVDEDEDEDEDEDDCEVVDEDEDQSVGHVSSDEDEGMAEGSEEKVKEEEDQEAAEVARGPRAKLEKEEDDDVNSNEGDVNGEQGKPMAV
eukprot:189438-Hanusia_phi.AAC.1